MQHESSHDDAIGRALRTLRGGRSQQELAEEMRSRGWKWTQATVWGVESAKRPLRLAEAQDLADFFRVDISALTGAGAVLGSLAQRLSWSEQGAWSELEQSLGGYAYVRTRRQIIQMFNEIALGSPGPYVVRGLTLEETVYRATGLLPDEPHTDRSTVLLELGASETEMEALMTAELKIEAKSGNNAYDTLDARDLLLLKAIGSRLPMVTFRGEVTVPPAADAVYVEGLQTDWVPGESHV